MSDITFFTQCWEGDWNIIINQGGLEKKLENLNYNFDKKILIITNVNNREIVEESVKYLVSKNIIDGYYFTDDYSDEVLSHFEIQKDSFNGGYWYSISPLLSVYLCDTKYMIYLTADSLVEKTNNNWISDGVEMLSSNPDIKVVNPLWNNDVVNAERQELELNSQLKNENWWYGRGFSDQCFLIESNIFKERIYNTQSPLANLHYPEYAGDSFEKRIYSYLITNNYYRITNKQTTYYHPRWS